MTVLFFINDVPAFVYGRGEKLKKIKLDLEDLSIVIVYPGLHIDTGFAYRNIVRAPYKYPLKKLSSLKITKWHKQVENDFEGYAFTMYPVLKKIKDELYKKGALYASMSGSGSAIYGLFEEKIKIPKGWERYSVFQGGLKLGNERMKELRN